ncbi:putative dihydrolipoamide dehydrogenase, putative,acetoin dehydrogenase e3 component [Trypanosoma rangeli]|uniref:Putative dihydrolipoamide dehydrogenase, putative,acetoin dehydrogenase e3 component n=1 Tax=Trypanosoma rangeli TaxID=5698 RepID=A0A422NPA5_TRYRA|nr:putative dihydrolipoamide dehydrogenase, putative,acetoin dehydrogenase e3 component [Trypanosoma rangeli]RNF07323.1 putative dihydrolipoamide dehydrogenase, putative,acetoin dehydrogenase e3 component [Trypanosoma rangeli]|eukprot:RNF07323.1 putative dihydrolipoamide dehydrogenase, putative,acetoin dehydrogenase e3 component [Trypanosoma rangeli]
MLRRTLLLWGGKPPLVRWRPLDVSHFDVCVIGAGPAGIASALRAVNYKKRVCLIEAKRVGGCDLWNGALQSKMMWEMSNFFAKANGSAALRVYKTTISSFMEPDEKKMRESLVRGSEIREQQILEVLRTAQVSVLYGGAFFISPHEVEVRNRETKEYRTVTADYFIIATGSTPNEHPYVQTDRKHVVTSDELMMMPLPKSMVIVGAGVLGSEFAAIYARLGKTKVYLIDKERCILPGEDDDIVEKIQQAMEADGVVIHRDSVLYHMRTWEETDAEMQAHPEDPARRGGVRYSIMNKRTREIATYEVERALIAIGRAPNYKGLGLQNAKCRVREGALVLDPFGKCADHDHIYAVGDAANDSKLVSVGETKGRLVVDHIFGVQPTVPLQHDFTRLIFMGITVASVGMNEKQCRKKNISYRMARYGLELCSRTIAADNTNGFVKIITTNDSKKMLLGVRVLGMNASAIIELAAAAIRRKQSAYELSKLLTAYPSVSQAFLECLCVILDSSTLKPGSFPGLICYEWTPPDYERGRAYASASGTDNVLAECPAAPYEGRNMLEEKRCFRERASYFSTAELRAAKKVAEAVERGAVARAEKASIDAPASDGGPLHPGSFFFSLGHF